jgi:hypothetical protein
MFRSLVFKRTVASALLLCLLAMFACDGHQAENVAAADPPPEPDVIDDDGETKGSVYLAGNPFHERRMEELRRRPEVSATVSSLRYRGFELSPENSFTMTGDEDGMSLSVTFIAMTGGGDKPDQSATVACYEIDGELGVSSIMTSAAAPEPADGWRQSDTIGWYRVVGPDGISLSPQRVDWWSWQYFANCMYRAAPALTMTCVLTCLGSPMAYWPCFMYCTFIEAGVAAITCLFNMYDGYNNRKKEK